MHHILKRGARTLLLAGFVGGLCATAIAMGHGRGGPGLAEELEGLDRSQRAELHARRLELEEQGAAPSELRAESRRLLEGWGVELPERRARKGEGRGPQAVLEELSATQRAELYALRRELRADGASREEVRQAEGEALQGMGVELPERPRRMREGKGGPDAGLSDSQREELHSLHQELREQGKEREEIREACDALLKQWGIEAPVRGMRHGKGHGPRGTRFHTEGELERTQRAQLYQQREELLAAGTAPSVIRERSEALLASWGVAVDKSAGRVAPQEQQEETPKSARVTPNPFNPETTLAFQLEETGMVNLTIYDIQGRRVRNIGPLQQTAGEARIKWDGRNDAGTRVASGTYVYTLTGPGLRLDGRMSLIQ